ncbi:hypothetical protein LOZ80_12210 [Paenibacillus sp. HWE-109]|uniref:hypothetical protein n=1 Tax=Paenibacillus sp. HWE-109 TaxID=1306526 RepID=UPI001EDEA6C8|nr:hypothetical protein [Paenibacillus sp. HWE-109]UKS29647.1 hypothetical protein LOZ80_12210 [Paenibacillus sp. HWE-109]
MNFMKCYFRWDEQFIGGTTYIKIDDGYATKQIVVTPNKYIASNRKDEEHHFYLAEGLLDANEIIQYGGSEISEKQFYDIWNEYRDGLIDKWNVTKGRFPIGLEVEGIIEVFYPQGVIVSIRKTKLVWLITKSVKIAQNQKIFIHDTK